MNSSHPTAAPINFYRVSDPYGEFSNFSAHPIKLNGHTWPTAEHYFQGQKFPGTAQEKEIRETKSPMIAARLGRSRKVPIRQDWEQVKENIMCEALRAKFTQHPELRELLLCTGEAKLVEHTTNDSYWGDGGDGTGRNRSASCSWNCARNCAPKTRLLPPTDECSPFPTQLLGGARPFAGRLLPRRHLAGKDRRKAQRVAGCRRHVRLQSYGGG